jgi:hypothetical protein
MVPGSDHVHPHIDQGFEGIGLDTGPASQVLAVRYCEINGIVGFYPAKAVVHGMAAWFPDDVPDDQDVHGMSLEGVVVQEIRQKQWETQLFRSGDGEVSFVTRMETFFGKDCL